MNTITVDGVTIPAEWFGVPTDADSRDYQDQRVAAVVEAYTRAGREVPGILGDTQGRMIYRAASRNERWEIIVTLEAQAVADGVMTLARSRQIDAEHEARVTASRRAFRAALFGRDFHQLPRADALMTPCPQCAALRGDECRPGCTQG